MKNRFSYYIEKGDTLYNWGMYLNCTKVIQLVFRSTMSEMINMY